MIVEIDHPWSTRPLTEEEIAEVQKKNVEQREEPNYQKLSWIGRLTVRTLDNLYVRALKRGQNMEEARTSAPNVLFAIGGAVVGWGLCVVVLSVGTMVWDYATASKWVNLSLTFLWVVILVLLFTGVIQRWVTRGVRKLKERRTRKEK